MTPVTLPEGRHAPLTERDAEKLSPEQATALVRVLELQAKWDGLLTDKSPKTTMPELHVRQKANDAYQAAMRDYAAKYPKAVIPEPTHAMPERVAAWCRTLRVVFARAEGGSPTEVMGKVYRLADRTAGRMGKEPVARTPATELAGAVRELDAVIAWCEALIPTPLLKLKKDVAA
jgi:hypothetical protein